MCMSRFVFTSIGPNAGTCVAPSLCSLQVTPFHVLCSSIYLAHNRLLCRAGIEMILNTAASLVFYSRVSRTFRFTKQIYCHASGVCVTHKTGSGSDIKFTGPWHSWLYQFTLSSSSDCTVFWCPIELNSAVLLCTPSILNLLWLCSALVIEFRGGPILLCLQRCCIGTGVIRLLPRECVFRVFS